jgi:2-phosphoglycerate kinase
MYFPTLASQSFVAWELLPKDGTNQTRAFCKNAQAKAVSKTLSMSAAAAVTSVQRVIHGVFGVPKVFGVVLFSAQA